jgi:fucose 4-O-acetylase-like acetyltransferase
LTLPQLRRHSAPDVIRGIAIVFVVAIHAFAYLDLPIVGPWAPVWFMVDSVAVPAFFFAEGWLFASRHHDALRGAAWKRALVQAGQRLLIPWAIFSSLYLAERVTAEWSGIARGASVLPQGAADIVSALWLGKAAAQLYFLPALFLVRAISYLVFPGMRGRPLRACLFGAGLLILWRLELQPLLPLVPVGVDPLGAAVTGLAFAAFGWAVSERDRVDRSQPIILGSVLALAIVAGVAPPQWAALSAQLSYLLALWLAAVLLGDRPPLRLFSALGRNTMGIYLLHGPIIIKLVSDLLLKSGVSLPVALVIDIAVSIALALLAATQLRRFAVGRIMLGEPGKALRRDFPPVASRE